MSRPIQVKTSTPSQSRRGLEGSLVQQAHQLPPRYEPVPQADGPLSIMVLYGGNTTEREVSLKSGEAVATALRSRGHRVELVDLDPADLSPLDQPVDVVFIALHGRFGEDGQLQQILESRGLCYCGSGPLASAMAMDKAAAKERFVEVGIPTPAFEVLTAMSMEAALRRWPAGPSVLKPVSEGSSVGCELVNEPEDLRRRASELVASFGRCLLEACVHGPELTVGILGREALPPIEIRTRRRFYDYQAKYLDNDTRYLFDIDLPSALLADIQAWSLDAADALGCRDVCRVDWMVDEVSLRPYCLEINTIPGFTDHSLLPKAAARTGLSFAELCEKIIVLARRRSRSLAQAVQA